jgi:hypothetical protein
VAAQADGAVRIYRSGDASSLAEELNALLSSMETLRTAQAAALASSRDVFCWEHQAPILVRSVGEALKQAPAATQPAKALLEGATRHQPNL